MDLDDLRSFAQVVRHGGFSAAERATGERKAKLSRRVARLEADLKVRLIERSTRSLRVTEIGHEVFRQCEIIAESLETTAAIVARSRSKIEGNLRLSCPPGLARHLGNDVFFSFLAQHPLVSLDMHLTSRRVDLVIERYDAAFRAEIDRDHDQNMTMRPLGRMERILVAAPEVADAAEARDIGHLAELPTLSSGESVFEDQWMLLDGEGASITIRHRPRFCSNDTLLIRDAAVAGLGVALINAMACRVELESGLLRRVHRQWGASEGVIHLMFTTRAGVSPTLRAFIDHVAQAFDGDSAFIPP